MRRLAFILLAVALICSCTKEIRFVGQYDGEKIVLYSCANPDTTLSVDLAMSKFILDDSDLSIYSLVTGGKVSGYVGDRAIVFRENPDQKGNYISDYTPAEGETIELKASLPLFPDVTASTIVPHKADFSVDSYSVEVLDRDQGLEHVKVTMKVTINDAPSVKNCYRLKLFQYLDVEESDWRGMNEPPLMSSDVIFREVGTGVEAIAGYIEGEDYVWIEDMFDDSLFDGRRYQFEVWFESYLGDIIYTENEYGEWIPVVTEHEFDPSMYFLELDTVSEDLFKYSYSVAGYNFLGDFQGIFGEPVSIYNNVQGGIGCFGAITPNIAYLPE